MLEDNTTVGAGAVDRLSVDQNGTGGRRVDPLQNAEQRAFSAAAGADHTDEFTCLHGKGNILQRGEVPVALGVIHTQILYFDFAHSVSPHRVFRLFVLVEMLFQRLVYGIVRAFRDQAVQRPFVDFGIVEGLDVIIVGVAELDDQLLEGQRALLVGVGRGEAVAAIDLGADVFLVDVDVFLDVRDGLVLVFLGELVGLDQRTLEGVIGVRVGFQRCGGSDLAAAGLVLEGLLFGAVVDDIVALSLGQRGVGGVDRGRVDGGVLQGGVGVLLAVEVDDVDLVSAFTDFDVGVFQQNLQLGVLYAVFDRGNISALQDLDAEIVLIVREFRLDDVAVAIGHGAAEDGEVMALALEGDGCHRADEGNVQLARFQA